MLTPPEDEFDYEYEEDNFEDLSKKNEQKSSQTRASAQNNKVVNIHTTAHFKWFCLSQNDLEKILVQLPTNLLKCIQLF